MNSYIILVACVITTLAPLVRATSYTKVENIFFDDVTIKPGDVMQCQITKSAEEVKNGFHVNTLEGQHSSSYHLIPVSGKCFSFKVRAPKDPHVVFTATDSVDDTNKLEVIFDKGFFTNPFAGIRETIGTSETYWSKYEKSGLVNEREYRGFWIRWLDDELMEVGKESETIPFLSYRFPRKLQINYVGIMTWYFKGAWIIDLDPKCPGTNPVHKKKAESDCFLLQ